MPNLRELYQEVILDHGKRPRNFRKIEDANRHARGHNPLCGDKLSLYAKVEGLVKFEGPKDKRRIAVYAEATS